MSKRAKAITPLAKLFSDKHKRQSIRFEPDPGTLAVIEVNGSQQDAEARPLVGLVIEESYRGCSVVMRMTTELQVGTLCMVKVGQGPALNAEVRWRLELDAQIVRIGFMFID